MTTLLIDLDDTLLGNDMDSFLPAYLGAMGQHLADSVNPDDMVRTMISATQHMMENNRPDRTLKESFDPHFYPHIGYSESEMAPIFNHFYEAVFPTIRSVTQQITEAVDLIENASSRGYKIGIATNPLFPRTAITQRIDWAGLSEDEYSFDLIPSYETFHFAKPNPAFFAEFLTRMGWPNGPVVMIGDNVNHDVEGASSLGISTFWINTKGEKFPEGLPAPHKSGALSEIIPWLDSTPPETLHPDFSSTSAMIGTLRGSAAAMGEMLSEVQASQWSQRPTFDAWSLVEIICHLRDVEIEVNLPRLKKILGEDNPFIPGVDSDAWAEERNYLHQNGPQALADYVAVRIELLSILDGMNDADWNRPIRHAFFGPSDLKETVKIMSSHERMHGKQIFDCLKQIS